VPVTDREFTIVRSIPAPAAEVFRAWTEPDRLGWFANPETESEPPTVDLRVGGEWRILMVIDEELQYYTGGVYRDIAPNEGVVFHWGAVGGWPEIDLDNLDAAPLATVMLSDSTGGTELTFTISLPADLTDEEVEAELATGMQQGWAATLDRLVTQLSAS
jgi:uncharacterized protein YndB with AHSA1/START domain